MAFQLRCPGYEPKAVVVVRSSTADVVLCGKVTNYHDDTDTGRKIPNISLDVEEMNQLGHSEKRPCFTPRRRTVDGTEIRIDEGAAYIAVMIHSRHENLSDTGYRAIHNQ